MVHINNVSLPVISCAQLSLRHNTVHVLTQLIALFGSSSREQSPLSSAPHPPLIYCPWDINKTWFTVCLSVRSFTYCCCCCFTIQLLRRNVNKRDVLMHHLGDALPPSFLLPRSTVTSRNRVFSHCTLCTFSPRVTSGELIASCGDTA